MKKILFALLVVLSGVPVMSQNAVMLKMNLEKNKVYRLSNSSEQTITQTVNGIPQIVESQTRNSATFKMLEATPEFMVAEVRVDTMISKTNAMGKTTLMSSDLEGNIASKETADVISSVMNKLARNTLYVKIDYTGGVKEIINARMIAEMIARDTSLVTLEGPVGSAIKGQITGMVSESSLKTIVESFAGYLPGKSVNTGEKWSQSRSTSTGGMLLDIVTEYKLDRINNGMAEITAESAIKAAANATPLKSGPATVTYDNLQGRSKSTLVLDAASGLVINETAKTHISGNLGVSAQGMSLTIPMDISSESRTVSIK